MMYILIFVKIFTKVGSPFIGRFWVRDNSKDMGAIKFFDLIIYLGRDKVALKTDGCSKTFVFMIIEHLKRSLENRGKTINLINSNSLKRDLLKKFLPPFHEERFLESFIEDNLTNNQGWLS